jgi:hypothetical protein
MRLFYTDFQWSLYIILLEFEFAISVWVYIYLTHNNVVSLIPMGIFFSFVGYVQNNTTLIPHNCRRGHDCMVKSVSITTDVVNSSLDQDEVYNIMWKSLSVTCDRSVVFSGSSGFLHQ